MIPWCQSLPPDKMLLEAVEVLTGTPEEKHAWELWERHGSIRVKKIAAPEYFVEAESVVG